MGPETILGAGVIEWLLMYGYPVVIIMSILDSTYLGFFVGALSSIGVFNPFFVLIIYISIRFLTDTLIFMLARSGSSFLEHFNFVQNIKKKINSENSYLKEKTDFSEKQIIRTLFIAKIIPIPIFPESVLVVAGFFKANYKKLMIAGMFGQLIWTGTILAFGYYFGDVIQNVHKLVNVMGFIIGAVVLLFFVYYKYGHEYVKHSMFYGYFLNRDNLNSATKYKKYTKK